MPFIVRCANPACRKYNLIEDEVRGETVNCLVCREPMQADSKTSMVVACPGCDAKMRVPSDAAGKRVQCPRCGCVFQ